LKGASQVSTVSAERVAALYRAMARIRAFENAAEEASKGGVAAFGASLAEAKVRGPLHLSTTSPRPTAATATRSPRAPPWSA